MVMVEEVLSQMENMSKKVHRNEALIAETDDTINSLKKSLEAL